MDGDADLAAVAAIVAEPARARILTALGDGRALPASVLAAQAGVAPSTASQHLAKLVAAGFLSTEPNGRRRYFRLAGPEINDLLEALARLAPPEPVRSLRQGTRAEALRRARTCYDHLAGKLGTGLMAALLDRELLANGAARGGEPDYHVTQSGLGTLRGLGIDLASVPGRRPAVRHCLDWSEKRHHVGGKLGKALADRFFEFGWIERYESGRAVRVTPVGERGLVEVFGLEVA
ncbi:MAG TPA: metalloregulator ArsR/SmtB family transcription factor [Gaiellaceae bacterium]|jgi:DNA-binding transcriptional ArsR family regulator|nr:metalloregulator ArsR/SmtB family transcription factor [Gaiellaceae bacterium]